MFSVYECNTLKFFHQPHNSSGFLLLFNYKNLVIFPINLMF